MRKVGWSWPLQQVPTQAEPFKTPGFLLRATYFSLIYFSDLQPNTSHPSADLANGLSERPPFSVLLVLSTGGTHTCLWFIALVSLCWRFYPRPVPSKILHCCLTLSGCQKFTVGCYMCNPRKVLLPNLDIMVSFQRFSKSFSAECLNPLI